ncbi:uncharacterized protein LOC122077876 [Macadamia integrifolia]|uniref:uncharacterized protein LOC122077876 n=1 Tax=Macadamia integrifolia TaxID=60698 RepID=UPI001C4E567E|nr:uncharacterized protein LOC122077876 [Macadamia integrifolia]
MAFLNVVDDGRDMDHDPGGGRPPDRGRQLRLTDFWKPKLKDASEAVREESEFQAKEDLSTKVDDSRNQKDRGDGVKKTFSTVVGKVLPDVEQLPDPIHAGAHTKIIIPQEAYEERLEKFKFALIGRANFKFMSMNDIRKAAGEGWKLKGRISLSPMGKGFILFQFELEGDMSAIWRRNLIKVRGQLIRFQRWKPDFDVHAVNNPTKLVWIRFPGLPLEYWHEKILLTMAKGAGKPVALDRRTRSAAMGNFARVQVEVIIGEKRVEEIQVERKQPGTGEIFWFKQLIVYEDGLAKCGFCKKIGHTLFQCKEKKEVDAQDTEAATMVNEGGAGRRSSSEGGDLGEGVVSNLGRNLTHMRQPSTILRTQIRDNSPKSKEGVQRQGDIEIIIPVEKSTNMGINHNRMGAVNSMEGNGLVSTFNEESGSVDGADMDHISEPGDEAIYGREDHIGSGQHGEIEEGRDVRFEPQIDNPKTQLQYKDGVMIVYHEDVLEVDRMASILESNMEGRRQQKAEPMLEVQKFPKRFFNNLDFEADFIHNDRQDKWQSNIFTVSFIHANCFRAARRDLWSNLAASNPGQGIPWMVTGDFNATLYAHEKRGPGSFNLSSAADFGALVDSCSLIQIPSQGRKYTWTNNRRRDHSPLLVVSEALVKPSNCPFRFQRSWIDHENFLKIVKESWDEWMSGSALYIFSQKIKRLKIVIKEWARETFPNVNLEKEEALKGLEEIQKEIEEIGMNDQNFAREADAKTRYLKAMEGYEKFWAEKARIRWRTQGDRSSKFFHMAVKVRRMKNTIRYLKTDSGQIINEKMQLEEFTKSYYENFLKKSTTVDHMEMLDCIPKILTDIDRWRMDAMPSNDEIKKAVWDLDPESSPGPDGFPEGVKIDIQKAYDTIDWDFIFHVLRKFGFSETWIRWVYQMLVSAKISVIFNGGPIGYFGVERGLRQGDPISPMLFILAEEVLCRGLNKLVEENKLKPIKGPRDVMTPVHSLFADDIFIFANASIRYVRHLKKFLNMYQEFSGQCINLEKSKLFVGSISSQRKRAIVEELGISLCTFPTRYLGVEIFKGRVKKDFVMPIMDKVKGRLAGWKGKMLSLAGRVELVKSVIMSMPAHSFAVYWWPSSLITTLERWMRNFVWSGEIDATKKIVVNWDQCCKPKEEGGLGLRRLRDMNKAMLCKTAWRIKHENSLTSRFLRARFLNKQGLPKEGYSASSIWPGIRKIWNFISSKERWVVGDGCNIKFWKDNWVGGFALEEYVEDVDRSMLDGKVDRFIVNHRWNIPVVNSCFMTDVFNAVLQIKIPNYECVDRCVWSLSYDGNFNLKSAWEDIREKKPKVPWASLIWCKKQQPRVSSLAWRVIHGKVHTDEMVKKKAVPLASRCVLWVFEAEVEGLMEGLMRAKDMDIQHLWIESDSSAVVFLIQQRKIPWFALQRWLYLQPYMRRISWKISHNYREGNSVADFLARDAAKSGISGVDVILPPHIGDFLSRDAEGRPNYRFP